MSIVLLGKGFIGGRLLAALEETAPVRCYDSTECDLTSREQTATVLAAQAPISCLIISAWIGRLRGNDRASFAANLYMAGNIAAAIEQERPAHVIFLSSVDVYGLAPALPITEGSPPAPADFYALSKLNGEFMLADAAARAQIPLAVLRLPGVYGRGDSRSTLHALVRSALERGRIDIFGDGGALRDFLYVDDLCRLVAMLITERTAGTFNVATGVSRSINEIVNLLQAALPQPAVLQRRPLPADAAPRVRDLRFDVARLRAAFPAWRATDLAVGVKEYLRQWAAPA